MATVEQSSLDAALKRAQPHEGETGAALVGTVVGTSDPRVRAGVKEKAEHPLSAALKRRAASDPEGVADVYYSALSATKRVYLGDEWRDEPDYNVRLKAADSISNRVLGLPVAAVELTGAEGGPVVLAALLASDPADLI